MKRTYTATSILLSLIFVFANLAGAESQLPLYKQTKVGLYVTSKDAFENWIDNPEEVVILDVRDPAEYIFVGHPSMARNIPLKLFSAEKSGERGKLAMETNPDFVSEVKKHYQPTDTIFIMCRSGGRSAQAVNLLVKEGFQKVYNVTDGFEGDIIKDPQSYYSGKRVRNGWKNSGAPWTYELDAGLMYHPSK